MPANITLRLDEKILRRVRHFAVDRNTSVSAWAADLVTRTVEELDGFEVERRRALRDLAAPVRVRDASTLTRDEAHGR